MLSYYCDSEFSLKGPDMKRVLAIVLSALLVVPAVGFTQQQAPIQIAQAEGAGATGGAGAGAAAGAAFGGLSAAAIAAIIAAIALAAVIASNNDDDAIAATSTATGTP
jgi:hypothetical protein